MARTMDLNRLEKFRDWLPVRCYWRDGRVFVDWCYLGKTRLTEPFFDDSIRKRFREPFNLLFRPQTPIELLGELNAVSKAISPTGFIFHLSRCGSTLVSQMLAAVEKNIVVSEASPFDFVLRKTNDRPENERIEWLRWMMNAFGQRRNPPEENFFVKFDSWNTLEIELVRRAFPEVPWIFLYRHPVEIIVSHLRQRGAHMIPGLIPEILPEISFERALQMPAEEYCARVMGKICRSAAALLKNGEGLAVDYTELPGGVVDKILDHFKIAPTPADAEKMLRAAAFNAKTPALVFSSDTAAKKKEAGAAAIRAAGEFVLPIYEELETIRKNAENSRV